MTGDFGHLSILSEFYQTGQNASKRVLAICVCGTIGDYRLSHLKSGNIRSCGCYRRLAVGNSRRVHGAYSDKTLWSTHTIWKGMKERCLNVTSPHYLRYGGRGIKLCERWLKFENFLEDMGKRPIGLSINRINNDGDYEPSNCHWATASEQAQNRRSHPRGPYKKRSVVEAPAAKP